MSGISTQDLVVGFSVSINYQGDPDGIPVLMAAPVRQRADGGDYINGCERTVFARGAKGIEQWMEKFVTRELQDPNRSLGFYKRHSGIDD